MKLRRQTRLLAAFLAVSMVLGLLGQSALGAVPNGEPNGDGVSVQNFPYANSPDLPAYDAAYRVGRDKIQAVTTNAGQYGSSSISNCWDDNWSTHWEAGKANGTNHTSQVTFLFKEIVEFSRVVYATRQDGARPKGFPTRFEIYASLTDSGEDFTLVASGSAAATSAQTEIRFQNTQFRRFRFVWTQANQNWASASEFHFYRDDPLPDMVNGLFTDKTMSELKAGITAADIQSWTEQAQAHPMRASLLEHLELAQYIIDHPGELSGQVMVLEQKGNRAAYADKVLGMGALSSNSIPTGIVAHPGETLKIYVDVDEGAPVPGLLALQHVGTWNYPGGSRSLHAGENIVTVPDIPLDTRYTSEFVAKGGPIYLVNPYTPAQQGSAPRVRIEGGETYPLFRDGGDVEAFKQSLAAYKEKLDADKGNKDQYSMVVDVCEIYSDHFIFTGDASAVYNVYLNEGKDPQTVVSYWNQYFDDCFAFMGVDGKDGRPDRGETLVIVRHMQPYAGGYAAGGHLGFWKNDVTNMFRGEGHGNNWLISHELGHQMDAGGLTWGEVTNNVLANHWNYVWGQNDRVAYGPIFTNQSPDDYQETPGFDNYGYWDKLALFWQLELYDPTYWTTVQAEHRARTLFDETGLNSAEKFVLYASHAIGQDLTEYFARYKFGALSEKGRGILESWNLPKLDKKIWYLWTKANQPKGPTSFEDDMAPEITSVTSANSTLTIQIAPLDERNQQALLGYEILDNGKVIGFTKSNTFTGVSPGNINAHNYTVRPYDLELNAGVSSGGVETEVVSAQVTLPDHVTLTEGQDFDPMAYVRYTDDNGNNIKADFDVDLRGLDTARAGSYVVAYQTKLHGKDLQFKLTVNVLAADSVVYASDIDWLSATCGWPKHEVQRDQSVQDGSTKLKMADWSNIKTIAWPKGLGTHANSEIIYDISSGSYDTFETFVGADHALGARNGPSMVYKIYLDGKEVFDSGLMNYGTPIQFVSIDLSGAKELKLAVGDSGNGNAGDHAAWADAKFLRQVQPEVIPVESVRVDPAQLNLKVGEQAKLTVTYEPENATLPALPALVGSDPAVVEVEADGTVRAVAPGTVTLTAIIGDLSATCTITVSGSGDNTGPSGGGDTGDGDDLTGGSDSGSGDTGGSTGPSGGSGDSGGSAGDGGGGDTGGSTGNSGGSGGSDGNDGWIVEETKLPASAVPERGDLPFTDVPKGSWYFDAVKYVYEHNLFAGVSELKFEPDTVMTRAMLVTVLWRMEHSPKGLSASKFADVAEGAWYADAVGWAAENHIVEGYDNGKFMPNLPVSREQLATILYRYHCSVAGAVQTFRDLAAFTDGQSVSLWANDALRWCVAEGLVTGKAGNRLDPSGQATRAEVATIFTRYST